MSDQVKGIALTLLGGICWGVSGSIGQYLFDVEGMDSRWLVPIRLGLAGIILLIYSFLKYKNQVLAPWKNRHERIELGIVGVVLIGNVMAFPCYMTGVRLIGADKAILYGFSEPVSAAIIGSAFLGSPFTLWDGLGFVLVFAMMVLTSISAKAESAENAK